MRKEEVTRYFIFEFYGSQAAFRKAVEADYCKEQLSWACLIDCLCKDGVITQRQYDTWTFPGDCYRKGKR